MNKHHSQKSAIKYLFVPLILLSLFSFSNNNVEAERANAATVITTKASDEYINNYYSSIGSSLTGTALASALETRLKAERGRTFSYDSLEDTAFPYTDVDPTRPNDGYILSFYSGKAKLGYTGMNKEHTWPNSHGGNKIENDPHMVRPTITAENSSRGNEYYSNTAAGWDPYELGDITSRGMSARIILYGAVIGKTSGLILEDVGRGQGSGTGNKMGKLGDLLQWNIDYPVNQKEIIRNETLDTSLNYNRNPFIDRPEYGCKIWGDTNANTKAICAAQQSTPTITLDKTNADVNIGNTTKITATVTNSTSTVSWSSSSTSIANVNTSGTVFGVAKGTATITAKIIDNSVQYTATCVVVVKDPNDVNVTGIQLDKTSSSILVGETTSLTATVLPANASINTIKWTTSNSAIATISSTTSKTITVTGVAKGTATITATTDDGGFKATCNVIVTSNAAGATTDALTYSDFGLSAKYNNYSYTSLDSGASYEVYAYLGSGNTIQMNSGKNAGFVVTTSAGKLKSVTVNWQSASGNSGRSVKLYGSNTAYTSTASSAITSTTNLGTFSYGSGSSTYTFTSDYAYFAFVVDGGAAYFTSIDVVWEGGASGPVLSSISVASNPSKMSYTTGQALDLTGLVVNANYSNAPTSAITEYSTTPAEGDILSTAGTQTITIYFQTKTTSFNVAVVGENVPMIGVSLNFSNATLDIGGTLSLSHTINPTNAYPTPTIGWTSSNSTVASVSNGQVTALKAGSATITVTATQSAIVKTATCSITVNQAAAVVSGTYTIAPNTTAYLTAGSWSTSNLDIDKSESSMGNLTISGVDNVRLNSSPNANKTITIGGNATTGGKFTITLPSGLIATAITFNDLKIDSGKTPKLTINDGVNFTLSGNKNSETLYPYANALEISTLGTSRIWTSSIQIEVAMNAVAAAEHFGTLFLSKTSAECASKNVTSATWNTMKVIYENADANVKALIKNTEPDASGTDLEEAIARYLDIVRKYGHDDFVDIAEPSGTKGVLFEMNDNAMLLAIIIISFSVTASGAIYLLKKRKEQ